MVMKKWGGRLLWLISKWYVLGKHMKWRLLVLLIGLKDIWLGSSAMSVLSPDHLIQ